MGLEELQWHWNEWGKLDPLWAILTRPDKVGGNWNLDEFFQVGKREIALVLDQARILGFRVRMGRALDFGCGVGRLTQALCERFDECYGVDIAPSMIELANKYNRFGDRCHYQVNSADDLRLFEDGTFDFIYSSIVLQHIQPEFSTKYMREFTRVLAYGGLAVFQVPSSVESPVPSASAADGSALPDAAFRATISLTDRDLTLAPRAIHAFRVKVRNDSDVEWPRPADHGEMYAVRLGNHWYDADRNLLAYDDQRVALPAAVPPHMECDVEMIIRMPARPGNYLLALDLVQEGVAWFELKGTEPAYVQVQVVGEDAQVVPRRSPEPPTVSTELVEGPRAGQASVAAQAEAAEEAAPLSARPATAVATEPAPSAEVPIMPRMEMHCVPREQVLEIIEEAGCRLVALVNDASAPGFVSYRYFFTRLPGGKG